MTLADWVAGAARRLAEAGLDDARREARVLAAVGLGLAPGAVLTQGERVLSAEETAPLAAMLARRVAREPLSRIVGRRGFWTLELALSPDTLDPRPDTETLVQAGLDLLPPPAPGKTPCLLDLGTGSGCVLLALLSERPDALGVGVDIAPGAAATAQANARALGLADRVLVVVGDWLTALRGPFDLIVSNPPYIPSADIAGLEPEVRCFDPWRALDGGPDGLAPYRLLAREAPARLTPGGALAVEVGQGQDADVAALLAAAGWREIGVKQDLAGVGRCVVARGRQE
ncbi:peptide chain release factor N(5)-glutamine methyltransferase [Pararhodospirillum photometricum]|uniref:Release factor glutamine methyltransferase n=1 Tax=Pararhodospirillum photometricum DSM 122 TaxID=1150469 RepID=H6SJY6_PARPM|nr:peptide chain release factor N(5)-glutamine methyltransferase [Pararhodospirillum photometricum]CCG08301.1 Modification methylase HemK [Pararhodospirillum photometricum DSM 122]